MNKAQVFAEICARQADPPEFRCQPVGKSTGPDEWFAAVDKLGHLSLRGVVPASQALNLAKWIVDTYGEEK